MPEQFQLSPGGGHLSGLSKECVLRGEDRATANRGNSSRGWAAEEKQRDGATSDEGFRLKRRFVKMERTKICKC